MKDALDENISRLDTARKELLNLNICQWKFPKLNNKEKKEFNKLNKISKNNGTIVKCETYT